MRYDHRARFEQTGSGASRGEHPSVLGSLRFGGIETARHPNGSVFEHLGGNPRRSLLRPDEQDTERPASLGDVDQHVLDRALSVARGVLVQLV